MKLNTVLYCNRNYIHINSPFVSHNMVRRLGIHPLFNIIVGTHGNKGIQAPKPEMRSKCCWCNSRPAKLRVRNCKKYRNVALTLHSKKPEFRDVLPLRCIILMQCYVALPTVLVTRVRFTD